MSAAFTLLDRVHALRGGTVHPLGAELRTVASHAPAGLDPVEWALSVALVRGCVLSVQLARWDAETDTVHDDGPIVTAGPWHQADGPAWVVLDLQGGEIFGCWHADELARWLRQCIEQGPAIANGHIYTYRTTHPVEAERLRLHDPARWATWEQLDAWWARRQDMAWRRQIRGAA